MQYSLTFQPNLDKINKELDKGYPVIAKMDGLSLCKIHHAVFDTNIIGVAPNYVIKVRGDILHEVDGLVLKHGIQELQNQRIILTTSKGLWPDWNRLAVRYDRFREAG